ncbi:hypothetical protein KDL29_15415 [bacterium]|nr:hypothetical protein [bacterium]
MRCIWQTQLVEYREFAAPLNHHFRRWWTGPGRAWLYALIGVQVVAIVSLWQAWAFNTASRSATLFFASFIASSLAQLFTVVLAYLSGLAFQSSMKEMARDAVLPAGSAVARLMFFGALVCASPPFYCHLLYLTILQMIRASYTSSFLGNSISPGEILQSLLYEILPMLVIICCSLAANVHARGRRRSLAIMAVYVAITTASWLVLVFRLPMPFANMDSYSSFALFPFIGVCFALALIATLVQESADRSPASRAATPSLLLLGLLTLFMMVVQQESVVSRPAGLIISEISYGFFASITSAPFHFRPAADATFSFSDSISGLALGWIPNTYFPVTAFGEALASLLNLAWLAVVFLFCRWAVGRISWREED